VKQKIAVLGAGPMGLAVAYQLAKDGHEPVVFEADDRVGGMTATFDFNGLEIERYYHFHCISDHAFLAMLSELKIEHKMHWVETKMGYWYQNRLQAWGNPLALLSFKGLGWVAKFRYGLHAFLSTKRDNWKPLDHVEASAWIRRWVGAEAYEVLWRRLFDYKFYDHVGNLSAAWIWSRIRRIGRSRYSLFKEKHGKGQQRKIGHHWISGRRQRPQIQLCLWRGQRLGDALCAGFATPAGKNASQGGVDQARADSYTDDRLAQW